MGSEWKVVTVAVVLYGFLQLCGALELQCSVHQDGPRTTYSILHDFADFPSDPSCSDYSWTSSTVLANEETSSDPVINRSIDTLVSSRCIGDVRFRASRFSEGKIETEYTATCRTNCSVGTPSPLTSTVPWNPLWVAIPVLVLVLAVLCFLCYKFRDRIRRMRCCSQVGGYYRSVKMNNTGAEVEV